MTVKRPGSLLFGIIALVIGVLMGVTLFSGPRPGILFTRYGVFSRNNCGTYDRWVTWDGHRLHWPNGITGRDPRYCK